MYGAGLTVVGPRPQFKVTSPRTSVVMRTTAGLTRRMASWTEYAARRLGAPSQAPTRRSPSIKALMPPQRITEPAQRTMTPVPPGDRDFTLSLCEDTLPGAGRGALGALNRVLFVRRGSVTVTSTARATRLAEGEAWHGAHACQVVAGEAGGRGAPRGLESGAPAPPTLSGGAERGPLRHPHRWGTPPPPLIAADRADF